MEKPKIAWVIPTYRREDSLTKKFLLRTLESLKNQTYKDFRVYLIGDAYSDEKEFQEFNIIEGMHLENLPEPGERGKWTGHKLWCIGGFNASSYGFKKAIDDGYEWICGCDHDDFYEKTHVEEIVNIIQKEPNAVFVCSLAKYLHHGFLPRKDMSRIGGYVPNNKIPFRMIPQPGNMVRSSACVNVSKTKVFWRNMYEELGIKDTDPDYVDGKLVEYPGDAQYWRDLSKIMNEKNLLGFCTNSQTCNHIEEGYVLKRSRENLPV